MVLKEDGATLPSPHVLQFLGSFRKIVVEYFVTKFLSQKPEIVPQFIHVAFGSTNITSDYDVSFIGPGVADLIQEIIGEFTTLYGKSFPFLMDSNLYGAPMFVAPREGGWGAPDWLKTLDITSSVVSGAKSGALSTSGSFDAGK